MKRSKFTDSQIMESLKRVDSGIAVPEICRELGISTATFGMGSQVSNPDSTYTIR